MEESVPSLAEQAWSYAKDLLEQEPASHDHLNNVLRLLAKYRSRLIQNSVLHLYGVRVRSGPFAGLEFLPESAEGCHVPKLLGCYERELHPIIEAAIATNYTDIVNIGCAEGYYAVGLARRCPGVRVHAYDVNPDAQRNCNELSARNGVSSRVVVAGQFTPESFREFLGRRTLFVIDAEGEELNLIEGLPSSGLAEFDFIIECHDCFRPDISNRLAEHLKSGHAVQLVKNQVGAADLPPMFDQMGHLDQLLATWEWRTGPTPWLLAASQRWPDSAFLRAVVRKKEDAAS